MVDYKTEFITICSIGDLKQAQQILKENSDIINYKNKDREDTFLSAFIRSCTRGHLEVAKWLYNLPDRPNIDISYDNEQIFRYTCLCGYLEVAKWLLEVKPDINISAYYYIAFIWACGTELNFVKWLLEVKPNIDISAEDDGAFRKACEVGKLDIAKYLLEVKPDIDISANNEEAFQEACFNNYLEVAQWLQSFKPFKYVIELNKKNNNIEDFNINTKCNESLLFILYSLKYKKYKNNLTPDLVLNIIKYLPDLTNKPIYKYLN